jgi:hypothetical protein
MPKDILIQENGTPIIKDGDFVIGESTLQHQRSLLLAHPGEVKPAPTSGVGLSTFLESEDLYSLPGAVTFQFEEDGMQVASCEVDSVGKLSVEAQYVD